MSKTNKNYLNYVSYSISLFLITFLLSCKTLKINDGVTRETPIVLNENAEFKDVEKPYKYIFIRLYNPDYTDPFYIANLLQIGIYMTNIYPQLVVSHASINFSLEDNFWGLTLTGRPQFSREACSDISDNKYMNKCDPRDSQQLTYAIKVTEEEYYNAKAFVEEYARQEEIKYNTSINFQFAGFNIKRKFFTPKDHQLFGSIKYDSSTREDRLEFDPSYTENNFVCSTFIAYVLNKNVASVNQYFNEQNINYRYVNVNDIPYIPGIVHLFSSTWDHYLDAVDLFVQKYPEFSAYLTE